MFPISTRFYLKLCIVGKKAISEKAIQQGIYKCFWPGRYQIIYAGNITYHIDGAHTVESMVTCSDWFKKKTALRSHAKVLIYNATGDRSSENLLKELYSCNFDCVYFVPNVATKAKTEGTSYFAVISDRIFRLQQLVFRNQIP